MIYKLFKTDPQDLGSLIARITAGIIILPHGLQKLLELYGGYGFSATLNFFTTIGIPKIIGFLIISGESIGAFLLIIGLLGRISALGLILIMLGAILWFTCSTGFLWIGLEIKPDKDMSIIYSL